MNATRTPAEQVQGRTILATFHVKLLQPAPTALGSTDPAIEFARGFVQEGMEALKAAGEALGFKVEIEASTLIY